MNSSVINSVIDFKLNNIIVKIVFLLKKII